MVPPTMSRIIISALAASLLVAARSPVPNLNPTVTVNVDAALNRHAIDPRVYGVAFADTATIDALSIPLNRWGGNTTSRYNWSISTANHARDYFFENIPDTAPGGGGNGESADLFITPALAHGAQPIMTIPVLKYLPRARLKECGYSIAKYAMFGCCSAHAPAPFEPVDCGNGFSTAMGNPPLKHVNDPTDVETFYADPVSYEAGWIQHIIDAHGTAATTGVKYYAIDNEPDLWDSTHFDIHPDPSTYDELGGALTSFGPMIKSKDPSALVMAPEVSGWMWYFDSAYGWANGHNDQTNHGGVYFVPWLLQQAKAYEQANAVRILDVLSLHWYPQGLKQNGMITNQEFNPGNPAEELLTATKLLRNQSTRSLWDPNYTDQSWIHDLGLENNQPHLIPLLREWVNTYYPGTRIGITEYNWGAETDPNGATAQAEILGIFGREGLDLATRWTSPDPASNVYQAFKMYRNYDGAHSMFGNISVSAAQTDADIDNVSAFAALRSTDGALTIMVMGKFLTDQTPVTINISNYLPSGAAHYWLLDAGNAVTPQPDVALVGNTLSFTANPSTVNLFVIPGSYLNPPATVDATASNASSVTVNWPAAAGAMSYKIYRSTSINGPFNQVGTAGGTSFGDGGLAADTTYLYKVVSVSGSAVSPMSILDAATTTTFTDDPLNGGTVVKAVHVAQLRTAVNAMRIAAALGTQAFTDTPLNAGTAIKRVHITELRTALDQARAVLGLPSISYSDATLTPGVTMVKAAHIVDVRNGVK